MKKNRDLVIGLLLDAVALSGRLNMQVSLLLVFAAWTISIYGIFSDEILPGTLVGKAAQFVLFSCGAVVLGWWIYVPQPRLGGTLTTTGTATYRMVEFGDSGSIIINSPQNPDPRLAILAQNQALDIDLIDRQLAVTTKVLDKEGNLLAEVNRNAWRIPDPSRIDGWNYTKDTLEVIGPSDRVVLQVRLLPDRLQLQGEWWSEFGRGVRMVIDPDKGGGDWVLLSRESDPDEPHIRRLFRYPNKEHLGQLAQDGSSEFRSERVMYMAVIVYSALVCLAPVSLLLFSLLFVDSFAALRR